MALNHKDPMDFLGGIYFYKLTPQLIKFNIPTSFPALGGGTGVFISGIVNPIINSVKFLFLG